MVRAKQTSQCISEHLSELPLNDDDLLCELNTSVKIIFLFNFINDGSHDRDLLKELRS